MRRRVEVSRPARRPGVGAAATVALLALGGVAARGGDPEPGAPPPAAPAPAAPAADAGISVERLKEVVAHLASPELRGRGAEEDRKASAEWIAKRLGEAGAVPVPGKGELGFVLPFPRDKGREAGWNVAGWVAGTAADGEYVILSAHHDHLGVEEETLHPGADDNASGVAAVLEAARALARPGSDSKPKRSVMFVFFDLEERRCAGSEAFAANPPLPLDRCAAFATADMLGRSLGDLFPGALFAMGAERSVAVQGVLDRAAPPSVVGGPTLYRLGMDYNALGFSDYLPFEERRIPSLFFTTGASRDSHQPGDTPDKINYPRLAANAGVLLAVARGLADAPERPAWVEAPEPLLAEVTAVLDLVKRAGATEEVRKAPQRLRDLRASFQALLEGIVAGGKVTPGDRVAVRLGALRLFQNAMQAPR